MLINVFDSLTVLSHFVSKIIHSPPTWNRWEKKKQQCLEFIWVYLIKITVQSHGMLLWWTCFQVSTFTEGHLMFYFPLWKEWATTEQLNNNMESTFLKKRGWKIHLGCHITVVINAWASSIIMLVQQPVLTCMWEWFITDIYLTQTAVLISS